MKCNYCGWKNPATVTFCRKCGASLVDSMEGNARTSFPASDAPAEGTFSPRPPVKRKRVGRLILGILVLLVLIGAGAAWWIVSTSQSTTAISQTLQTYCNALQHADYQQAYDQWTTSIQMNETDFAYVQKNKARTTGCAINSISKGNTSALANLTFFFADGSTASDQVNLVLENGIWKIKSQSLS